MAPDPPSSLTCDGVRVAELEVAATARRRVRGLLGRNRMDGALLLTPARAVHSVGMRFAIDVAYLDGSLRVLAVETLPPHRTGRLVRGTRHVLEAAAGSFASWGVEAGAQLGTEPSREAA